MGRKFGVIVEALAGASGLYRLRGDDKPELVLAGPGLIGVGLVTGLIGAWMLSRVLSSLLYEVGTRDAAIFTLVPIVLLLPAAIATLIPTLRAMRVSPTEVMRAE